MLLYLVPLAVAFTFAYLVCPVVMAHAKRTGMIDQPDRVRKHHGQSIPLGGGIVILCAVFVASSLTIWMLWNVTHTNQQILGDGALRQLAALAIASAIIVGVGTVDDRRGMRCLHKLLGQTCAAIVLMIGGLYFKRFEFSGLVFELGHFGLILTLFWILGAINAINLIDGADGVAATIGIGIFGSLGAVSFLLQHDPAAIVPMATAGALLGFMVYNFPPAKMYLGDSGSMLIGLIAAGSAIHGMVKTQATFAIAVPVALLAIPIMDTSFAIFRRKLSGRSICDTDRGHVHHCLLDRGVSPRQLVLIVMGLSCATSLGAIASVWIGLDVLSLLAVVVILAGLARWRLFGHGELVLLRTTFMRSIRRVRHTVRDDNVVQIQGTREWSRLWETVVDFAKQRDLVATQLTINMPWLHEAVRADWGDTSSFGNRSCWQFTVPLNVDTRQAGWLHIVGRGHERMADTMTVFFDFVRELEPELVRIATGDNPIRVHSREMPAPVGILGNVGHGMQSVPTSHSESWVYHPSNSEPPVAGYTPRDASTVS